MKTQYTVPEVVRFLSASWQAAPESVCPLVEGHISQAYSFRAGDEKCVLRLAETDANFRVDEFAFERFGEIMPIPKVREIGDFNGEVSYCVTDFANGKTSNTLKDEELAEALPSIQNTLAATFHADISFSTGYGEVNVLSGSAKHSTWHEHVKTVEKTGVEAFKANAASIGLPTTLVDAFFEQYRANLSFASEERRLLHGDPAFDNMLVHDGQVAAVLDWAQLAYGDWMSDFARLDFWWPGRYGEKYEFAKKFGLEAEHLDEREALYRATNALWTIEFADKAKSKETAQWLHEHLESKLVI